MNMRKSYHLRPVIVVALETSLLWWTWLDSLSNDLVSSPFVIVPLPVMLTPLYLYSHIFLHETPLVRNDLRRTSTFGAALVLVAAYFWLVSRLS